MSPASAAATAKRKRPRVSDDAVPKSLTAVAGRKKRLARASAAAETADAKADAEAEAAEEGDDEEETKQPAAEGVEAAEEKPKPRRGRRRLLHDEEQRKQRRKNQCKLNQRRYRARQRGMISTLSLEAGTLGEFLHELEAYEQFLRRYAQCEQALVAAAGGGGGDDARPLLVVDEFLRVFERGFALHSVEIADVQERFVRFISSPALVSQGASCKGVDALLLQLKRYTSYHALFELHVTPPRVLFAPTDAHDGGGTWFVQASGRMRLRLSRDTVMLVYPHIVKDEALSYRVVGREIDPPCRLVFQFDALGKLSKLEFNVDFASAFVALLQSAALAAELLGRALISPHCELGIDPHEEAAPGATTATANKQLSLKFILL
ncbi:hypothetical protein PybrP1_007426 [[Pythium] brassicae (nom. inval.)]|nr:hypothetical protein PybrP1_007426 [[Pythium] brassicae (nom. inval.)]